jgi:hypothetical protein
MKKKRWKSTSETSLVDSIRVDWDDFSELLLKLCAASFLRVAAQIVGQAFSKGVAVVDETQLDHTSGQTKRDEREQNKPVRRKQKKKKKSSKNIKNNKIKNPTRDDRLSRLTW